MLDQRDLADAHVALAKDDDVALRRTIISRAADGLAAIGNITAWAVP